MRPLQPRGTRSPTRPPGPGVTVTSPPVARRACGTATARALSPPPRDRRREIAAHAGFEGAFDKAWRRFRAAADLGSSSRSSVRLSITRTAARRKPGAGRYGWLAMLMAEMPYPREKSSSVRFVWNTTTISWGWTPGSALNLSQIALMVAVFWNTRRASAMI